MFFCFGYGSWKIKYRDSFLCAIFIKVLHNNDISKKCCYYNIVKTCCYDDKSEIFCNNNRFQGLFAIPQKQTKINIWFLEISEEI